MSTSLYFCRHSTSYDLFAFFLSFSRFIIHIPSHQKSSDMMLKNSSSQALRYLSLSSRQLRISFTRYRKSRSFIVVKSGEYGEYLTRCLKIVWSTQIIFPTSYWVVFHLGPSSTSNARSGWGTFSRSKFLFLNSVNPSSNHLNHKVFVVHVTSTPG